MNLTPSIVGDRRKMPRGNDRRRAPRTRARHEAQVLAGYALLDAEAGAESPEHSLSLLGQTRDMSTIGLSLVVPSIRIDEHFCGGEGRTMRVRLGLPTAPVEFEATPVRCTPLDEGRPEKGYVIGAQIMRMTEDQRQRYQQYLRSLY